MEAANEAIIGNQVIDRTKASPLFDIVMVSRDSKVDVWHSDRYVLTRFLRPRLNSRDRCWSRHRDQDIATR